MFAVEGMDKVRRVIGEPETEADKAQKISNGTVIEIDGCSPLEIASCRKTRKRSLKGGSVCLRKGQRKPEIQAV